MEKSPAYRIQCHPQTFKKHTLSLLLHCDRTDEHPQQTLPSMSDVPELESQAGGGIGSRGWDRRSPPSLICHLKPFPSPPPSLFVSKSTSQRNSAPSSKGEICGFRRTRSTTVFSPPNRRSRKPRLVPGFDSNRDYWFLITGFDYCFDSKS